MKFPIPPMDKQSHFFAGAALCLAVSLFSFPLLGFAAALAGGAGKEWYDSRHPAHTVDVWDFVATALGGLLAFGLALLAAIRLPE